MSACIRLFVMLIFALTASVATAVPARPLYEPEPLAKPLMSPILAGTMWEGMLFIPNSKITFNADGTLVYGELGSGSPGSWKLEGINLYFEINKYSEYKTIVNGATIQGTGINKAGQECQPLLHLIQSNVPPYCRTTCQRKGQIDKCYEIELHVGLVCRDHRRRIRAGRPLYEPPSVPEMSVPTIECATLWMPEGMDQPIDCSIFRLTEVCSMAARWANHDQKPWKFEGNELYFEINNQYRIQRASAHDIIVGQS